MGRKELANEIRMCLNEMYNLEENLEKAYAEENDILIKDFTSKLEEINEKYVELRKEREMCEIEKGKK